MKTEQEYLSDLKEIRSIMEQSSRFISLSGLSGVMAGIYALGGVFVIDQLLYNRKYEGFVHDLPQLHRHVPVTALIFTGLAVLVLSLLTGWLLTRARAKKQGIKTWGYASKRLLVNLGIPLVTGGIFTLILLLKGELNYVAASTLIFYGLALVHGSRYTLHDVRYLGITQIILGLIATQYPGLGLYLWGIGFGVMHIFYGAWMFWKYER